MKSDDEDTEEENNNDWGTEAVGWGPSSGGCCGFAKHTPQPISSIAFSYALCSLSFLHPPFHQGLPFFIILYPFFLCHLFMETWFFWPLCALVEEKKWKQNININKCVLRKEAICVFLADANSKGEQIIRYSNIIRILELNTSIRIRIRVTFLNRILFVSVFRWFSQTEYYLYSYSGDFLKPNTAGNFFSEY